MFLFCSFLDQRVKKDLCQWKGGGCLPTAVKEIRGSMTPQDNYFELLLDSRFKTENGNRIVSTTGSNLHRLSTGI